MLKWLVVVVGIGLEISSTMIMGYRLHRWMLKHAPGLAALIPRDGGAILGFCAGAGVVWWWHGP